MVAIIVQLEINPDLESYTLRYYYTLATLPSKMTEVLQRVKDRIKECLAISTRTEILRHVKQMGVLPKKVRLQPASEFVDEKPDMPNDDESVIPIRRKLSENYSMLSHSDMMNTYRDRTADRKPTMTDAWLLEVMSKKEFEYPELITGNDSYKTSIFFAVRSELVQNGGQITYLPQISSLDEFYFLLNAQSLVKMTCAVIEKEPMKLIDPKSSFSEQPVLGNSMAEQPKRPANTTSSVERKEKIVTKMITVCIYATELKGGESEIIYTITNNLIEKNVLENFRRFIRRMSVMRADSSLAKYFLSEEPKEFRFQYPQVNDKTTFLLILKNNLHLLMSRVTGTLDHLTNSRDIIRFSKNSSPVHDTEETKLENTLNSHSKEISDTAVTGLLSAGYHYNLSPTCTDTVFFFNYNESNASLFGPVLFFLNIVEQDYGFHYFPEFQANDGQYTCLVKPNDDGVLEFDSLSLEDNSVKPRLAVLNGIKHIRHSKDAPPVKGIDNIVFHVSSRGPLKPEGLTEALGKAITNSVIELAIEQWLHSLYFKPGLNFKSDTREADIVHNLHTLQALGLQPPSVTYRTVQHKIQSLNYFNLFIGAVMRSTNRELSSYFKNKDSVECVHYLQKPGDNDKIFSSVEEMEEFMANGYSFDQLAKSFNESDSESESYEESMEPSSQIQSPTPPLHSVSLNASKIYHKKPRKQVPYSFDITKTVVAKQEAFVVVMRFRSPPVSDSTPLEQYSKVNAHQAEPKSAQCEHGEELKAQFPVRRFMVCLEVTKSDVRMLTYNVKEDVISKLFESLAEEVTFHEIRETLILGLSYKQVMQAVVENDTSDFDARLCERYEKTQIENHRRLNEKEVGLKLTWDYRFGDKDPNRLKVKNDQVTITDRVFELLRKTSNNLMLNEAKISISERHKTKQLMDAVCSTVRAVHRKIKSENLEARFIQELTFLHGSWFGRGVKSPSESRASLESRSRSAAEGSQAAQKDQVNTSIYLTVPRKSLDDVSEPSNSVKSKRSRPTMRRLKSSTNSPLIVSESKGLRLRKKRLLQICRCQKL